jgi:hypothetical protein
MKIIPEIRSDGKPPYFDAELSEFRFNVSFYIIFLSEDGRRIIFETAGLHPSDVIMRFNRLLGNPEFGKAGTRPV